MRIGELVGRQSDDPVVDMTDRFADALQTCGGNVDAVFDLLKLEAYDWAFDWTDDGTAAPLLLPDKVDS